MAILRNSTPFDSVQRKFSGTDSIHFCNRKADNATIGVRMKHPYDGGNSEAQQQVRTAFAATWAKVKEILADATQRAEYEKQFKAQKKYLYLRSFIFAKEYEKVQ